MGFGGSVSVLKSACNDPFFSFLLLQAIPIPLYFEEMIFPLVKNNLCTCAAGVVVAVMYIC